MSVYLGSAMESRRRQFSGDMNTPVHDSGIMNR